MTRSLYSRLFRYIRREGRSPLENFLTEALGDFVNRLTFREHAEFVSRVLMSDVDADCRDNVLEELRTARRYEWTTQFAIPYAQSTKYPDLVLVLDGRPSVVVENKIGADFTTHEEKHAEDVELVGQLDFYSRWLASQNTRGVLVLLTHVTEPPVDFSVAGGDAAVAHGVCRWRHVYRELKAFGRQRAATEPAATLARELAQFLTETEATMGVDDPGALEFSLAHAYHRLAHTKLQSAMGDIASFVKTRYPDGATLSAMNVGDNGHRISGYYRLNPSVYPSTWYASWGVLLPGGPLWPVEPSPALPPHEVVFALATSDRDDFPAHLVDASQRPASWHWPRGQSRHYGPVKTQLLSDMYGSPRGFVEEFKVWLTGALEESLAIFDAVARQTRK